MTTILKQQNPFGKSILLLDRYSLTIPALERLKKRNAECSDSKDLLVVVTKAKSNSIAYQKVIPDETMEKGMLKKKGDSVKLREYFDDSSLFSEVKAFICGKKRIVSYYMSNLL